MPSCLRDLAASQAGCHQPEDQARRSHPLCPLALAGLTRFIDGGHIELDNNTVERSIRGIKLSRKNAMFAGFDSGAEHRAVVATLVETCKINDIDPLAYLTDVLTKIVNGYPNHDIDQLLPWAYRAQ